MSNPEAMASEIWALIPLKGFSRAKTRLAGALSPDARHSLVLAMAKDVALALNASRLVKRVIMVSDIPNLKHLLGIDQIECYCPSPSEGLNEDLEKATEWACQRGARQALIVHADLPLLTAESVDRFITAARLPEGGMRLAASKEGSGTNLLLASLPLRLPLVFGQNSLARFRQTAMTAEVAIDVRHDPNLAGDIDEPDDLGILGRAWAEGRLTGSATTAWLRAFCPGAGLFIGSLHSTVTLGSVEAVSS